MAVMIKTGTDDDVIEEIQDRIDILKTNIGAIESNIAEESIPSVLSLNIDVYLKNKKKTLTLINKAKHLNSDDKKKLDSILELKDQVTQRWGDFEKKVDFDSIKLKVKESQEAGITNADDIEQMMGEFREAALVINHENRKKKAVDENGEEYKSSKKYESGKKNKNSGVPKSLRMVDLESEKYQIEKRKKSEAEAEARANEVNHEEIEDRTCMRCFIF